MKVGRSFLCLCQKLSMIYIIKGRALLKTSIRTKLIIMSLIFLAVPSLLIGISGYYSSTRSLNELGAKGLQTNVRMTIEMIEALDKQVKAGKIPLKEAQEQVERGDLREKG